MSRLRMIVGMLVVLVGLLGLGRDVVQRAQLNWARVVINQTWMNLNYEGLLYNDRLQDQIPDGWSVGNWGQSLAIHDVEQNLAYSGVQSAHIKKNNDRDSALYAQTFTLPLGEEVICGILSRGSMAFLRILAEGISGQNYANLPATTDWTPVTIGFSSSPDGGEATFVIGLGSGSGETWFDEAFCSTTAQNSRNLLENGGFEEDGIQQDPLEWWTTILATQNLDLATVEAASQLLFKSQVKNSARQINYLNVVDLLRNQPERVTKRMQAVSSGCLNPNGHPGILLALGPTFERYGGRTAHERVIKLSMALMPHCSQPYARLAELYWATRPYGHMADLYHEAALLAQSGPQKGLYYFAEGRVHIIGTGDLGRAITAFSEAERNEGWEIAPWYHGAAAIYLGKALTQTGHCLEAQAAYQRVLACDLCATRHAEARSALPTLRTECKQ